LFAQESPKAYTKDVKASHMNYKLQKHNGEPNHKMQHVKIHALSRLLHAHPRPACIDKTSPVIRRRIDEEPHLHRRTQPQRRITPAM
jgi:hypothetical protein